MKALKKAEAGNVSPSERVVLRTMLEAAEAAFNKKKGVKDRKDKKDKSGKGKKKVAKSDKKKKKKKKKSSFSDASFGSNSASDDDEDDGRRLFSFSPVSQRHSRARDFAREDARRSLRLGRRPAGRVYGRAGGGGRRTQRVPRSGRSTCSRYSSNSAGRRTCPPSACRNCGPCAKPSTWPGRAR